MRMCNAESQKRSAKGSNFKEDDRLCPSRCYYSVSYIHQSRKLCQWENKRGKNKIKKLKERKNKILKKNFSCISYELWPTIGFMREWVKG